MAVKGQMGKGGPRDHSRGDCCGPVTHEGGMGLERWDCGQIPDVLRRLSPQESVGAGNGV